MWRRTSRPGLPRLWASVATRWQEPGAPWAFVATDEDRVLFVPLVVRPIPAEIADGEACFDATGPRGYPGPIVGPILAGTYFGWLPAWIWIIVGAIFIGGVHDLMTLVASVRHDAKSIAEVVKRYMNRRSYLLFLALSGSRSCM